MQGEVHKMTAWFLHKHGDHKEGGFSLSNHHEAVKNFLGSYEQYEHFCEEAIHQLVCDGVRIIKKAGHRHYEGKYL